MQRSLAHGRVRPALLLLPLLLFGLVACSSASTSAPAGGGPDDEAPAATAGAAGRPGATAAPSAGSGSGGTGSGGTGSGGTGGNAAPAPLDAAKIVRTGSVEIEVSDLDASLVEAHAVVAGFGGYIGASQQSSGAERHVASITYRIPAADWDEAVIELKGLGTLVSERTEATEVAAQIVDLEARLTNLRASEERVRGYMAEAADVDTLLQLETRLTDIRGQIEGLDAQRVRLEDQAAYGTLTVLWSQPLPPASPAPSPVPSPEPAFDAGAEVGAAWGQLVKMGEGLATFLIWFGIVVLPVGLVFGAVILAVALVARRLGLLPIRPVPPA
jgi:hypothetical protein